ncbi:MAG: winged helix DNA-binding domain-containing protein [Jatrophihabitans sp.]
MSSLPAGRSDLMAAARISAAERRRRLAVRHALAPDARLTEVADVADAVVALHATDPTTTFLSPLVRMRAGTVADLQRALYVERSVLRMMAMRRTLWVAGRATVAVVQPAASAEVAARERRRLIKVVAELGVAVDPAAWLADVADSTVRAIAARGEAFATQLGEDEPRLRTSRVVSPGKRYEATVSLTSNVLMMLGAEGRIVRGAVRGSVLSAQYTWTTTESWLGAALPVLPASDARRELARRWLTAFGPATAHDLQWWTGWTKTQTRAAIAALDVVDVELDGAPGLVLADDLDPTPEPDPWAALLPSLDPTPMGWKDRDWFLGAHRDRLFDAFGNIGPTVWWRGGIVGGWARRPDGSVLIRVLEDVGGDALSLIERERARVEELLPAPVRVPRFPTPLERELRG